MNNRCSRCKAVGTLPIYFRDEQWTTGKHCWKCLKDTREQMAILRYRRKLARCCLWCGTPSNGNVRCARCQERDRVNTAKRKARFHETHAIRR